MCYVVHMKRRTNVSIEEDLFNSAKEHKIVLSVLLEQAIREQLKIKACENWVNENSTNLNRYNKRIAEDGVFSDEFRSF